MWGNVIVFAVIGMMLAAAIWKILRDKKNGNKCAGCPHGQGCPSQSTCTGQSHRRDPRNFIR